MDQITLAIILVFSQSAIGLPFHEHLEVDVDGGKDKDIFDINQGLGLDLFEGDIKLELKDRNSIIGDQYRWPIPVPYYLEDSLEINAKALVLEAFERYRLKTCIDFKPWEGEPNYISVFKESGCWSYIGNLRRGKQQLSLGANCDRIATIQHEFLHSLGFWHEQSRSDRDDYVIIMWDRIQSGTQNNFNTYNDSRSNSLNVPYDYTSVMHYSKTAFQISNEPTIVTRIPAFSDVIGQRMDFSDYDLEKLNRLYNCTKFISFLDTCDFEYNNICGMIQGTEDNADWKHVLQAPTGPSTDHTNLGNCKDSGYFMHLSTATLNAMDTSLLESRLFYPKRGFQCLEFFYYHNGHESDQLNIWIREYTEAFPNGTLKFIEAVNGQPADYWQLYHVSLSTSNKFRVVFQGVKGNGNSNGGFSIDDINFSEAKCPHYIWHIRNFTNQLNSVTTRLYSPPYYSKDGYAFQVQLRANSSGNNIYDLGIFFHLVSGENDNSLQWPCSLRQGTMVLMDQNPDIRKRMSNLRSITTDPYLLTDSSKFYWDKPEIVGTQAYYSNGTQFYRGPGLGTTAYITQNRVLSRDFLKGGDAFLLLSVDDISHLNTTQPIPPSTAAPPSTTTITNTSAASTTTTTSPSTTTTTAASTTTSTSTTTTSSGTRTTINDPSHPCYGYSCENDGVCTLEDSKPVCRCKVTKDWWYVGERCQSKVSSQDTVVIAVSSSVTIFVVMLVITLVSVYCVKKNSKQTGKAYDNLGNFMKIVKSLMQNNGTVAKEEIEKTKGELSGSSEGTYEMGDMSTSSKSRTIPDWQNSPRKQRMSQLNFEELEVMGLHNGFVLDSVRWEHGQKSARCEYQCASLVKLANQQLRKSIRDHEW
ncbi:meprin A subunit beta-like [Pseudophryne corroboree]|uniref:meprin A subunit beta-like n=1 Tax=Pseudophryne corroboree TaxID=495146 RepID=UPI0030817E69